MKGDRELDKWIAENVTNEPRREVDMITDVDRWGKTIYMGFTLTYPNYTSDMHEAISALKKYKELKGYIVYPDLYFDNPARQVCEFIYSAETGEDWENKQ